MFDRIVAHSDGKINKNLVDKAKKWKKNVEITIKCSIFAS